MRTAPGVVLHPRLQQECRLLGRFDFCEVLLRDVADLPWFILVPRTACTELYELDPADQVQLLREIGLLSALLKRDFGVGKLNVAAIGNIVSQMHVHVVGRTPGDPCWPGVVWGFNFERRWSDAQVQDIRARLARHCGADFSAADESRASAGIGDG